MTDYLFCTSCKFFDKEHYMIHPGDHFVFCTKEGGFLLPRKFCQYRKETV